MHNNKKTVCVYVTKHDLILQTPEEFHTFTTSCTERFPIMHLILRASSNQPIQKVLDFLNNIPDLFKVSSNVSSDGRKAGRYYKHQAQTILCEAAKNDNKIRTVLALINADTVVDDPESAASPLLFAAEQGSSEVIKALIKHGASVDHCNVRKETSLFIACKHAEWAAAKLLYDNSANVFTTNIDGKSAFTIAKDKHGVALLQHMAKKDEAVLRRLLNNISLTDACKHGYDLVARNYDIQRLSAEQIKDAVTESCLSRSTVILEHFSPKLDDHSLSRQMTEAYESGHCDCVDVLLKFCAERHHLPSLEISLSETCKNVAFTDMTNFLIDKDQDVNKDLGEPLRNAAAHGNLNAVKYLIQFGAEVNMVNAKGESPLLLACKGNHLDIVEILLNYTADINAETDEKETPLLASSKHHNPQLVNLLLSKSPFPLLDKRNKDGKTALEIAIDIQHSATVMALVQKGARLPFKHALHWNIEFLLKLCSIGNVPFVKLHLGDENEGIDHPRVKITTNEKLFNVLIRAGNIPLLQLLLTSDKIHTDEKTLKSALRYACMTGSVDTVKMIIQYDSGKFWKTFMYDNNNKSHLYIAICYEHTALVSLLLASGCVPDKYCPLSASFRSKDMLCQLLQHAMPLSRLNTTLMAVCKGGDRTSEFCARQLLNKSADANYTDKEDPDQLTVLMAATLKQSTSLVTLLLERGADPNITDNTGRSPLFMACDLGHHEVASLLLYNQCEGGSANPNLQGVEPEKYALWTACMRNHLDIVNLLINSKANPDLIGQDGCHLVQKAHIDGHYEVVRLLLESGADPRALIGVDLQESCHLGYSEYVHSIHQGESFEKLKMGIREACQSGYPETAMGIIIGITDENNQKECYDVWKRIWQGFPSAETVNEIDSQSREDNLLWQCFCSKNQEQMAQLINDGHNPNIRNDRGTPLLHACMQNKMTRAVFALCNCPIIDINQKDELGRTVLFYTLDWFIVTHDEQRCCMFDHLLQCGAEVLPDDFGRTLVHAWQLVPSGGVQGITLEKLTAHVPIDQGDFRGQTALHIAVLENKPAKVRELLEAGSNPETLDTNGISPLELAKRRPDDAICKMFSERCSLEGNMSDARCQNITEPENVHFSNEYNMEHRVTGALHKLFQQANQKSSSKQFMNKYRMPLLISDKAQFITEFKSFRSTILSFMKDIGSAISREDPLFGFVPVLSGSCSEGTKVLEMDEADVLCWFQHSDWQNIDLATHATH